MDDGWGIRLQSPLSVPGVWPATDEALRVQIAPSLAQVSVVVTGATGTTLDLNYKGLPGNQPTTYQNFVAVWQGTIVPWNQPPMRTMKIPGNFVEGSLVVDGVQIAELAYTVGYGVGPEITEICASAILGVGAQTGPTDSVSLSLNRVGTTSVSVHYSVLDGYLPATNHNWLGLWNGRVNPYAAPPLLARAPVPMDMSAGDVGFNGVVITRGTTYTLVYFMGENPPTAAAILTFATDDA